jgi:hypothetical protein
MHFPRARFLLIACLLLAGGTVRAGTCDIDADDALRPLSDGLLLLRYQAGFRDAALAAGTLSGATGRDSAGVVDYLDERTAEFDIDRDATNLPATDGRLFLRYLFGFRGAALGSDSVADDGRQRSPLGIASYLDWLCGDAASLPALTWNDGDWDANAWQ